MNRAHQILLVATSLLLAWLWMQIVHELGHCLGAWLTGGTVERVVLHPLAISRTDVAPNPQPLVVVWAGPIVGIAAPLVAWGVAAATGWQRAWWLRFFAGFCLLANGLYIGLGSLEGVGDAGDLLQHGSPVWTLWLFGLATAPAGLALWNGLGPKFGLGRPGRGRASPRREPTPIDRPVTYVCMALVAATALVQCLLSHRA